MGILFRHAMAKFFCASEKTKGVTDMRRPAREQSEYLAKLLVNEHLPSVLSELVVMYARRTVEESAAYWVPRVRQYFATGLRTRGAPMAEQMPGATPEE